MRHLRALVGVAISAAFLVYAFRGQDYDQIWDAITGVQYVLLIPALGLYFLGVMARSYRWSVLLRPMRHLSTWQLVPITAIGFMANNILPFRTGEVVRAYVLDRQYGVRKSAGLATIAVERICDGLTMLTFILVATSTVTFTNRLRSVTLIALVLFGVALAVLAVTIRFVTLRERMINLLLSRFPAGLRAKVEPLAASFFAGFDALRSGRAVALVAVSSLTAWLLEASMYWTIARAFGGEIERKLGVAETLLTTGVANLATLVPSSPGYVGPFEAGVVAVLNGALNAPNAASLSYAIVVHAALWFPITLWGAIEWSRHHVSWRAVRDEAVVEPDVDGSTSLNGVVEGAAVNEAEGAARARRGVLSSRSNAA